MRELFLIVLVATLITGCSAFFWPHRVQEVPTVFGSVLRGDIPVSGIEVFVVPYLHPDGCEETRYSDMTDDLGRFSISGERNTEWFVVVMGNRLNSWGICIKEDGEFIEGWSAGGIGYPPKEANFVCDLEVSNNEEQQYYGICRTVQT